MPGHLCPKLDVPGFSGTLCGRVGEVGGGIFLLFFIICFIMFFYGFWSILDAVGTPFGRLWGHMAPFFPLVISSRFLRCVFLTFRLPQGGPNACRRLGRGPSGALVKQHFGFITSGFALVKPHSVNLHPCASVKA